MEKKNKKKGSIIKESPSTNISIFGYWSENAVIYVNMIVYCPFIWKKKEKDERTNEQNTSVCLTIKGIGFWLVVASSKNRPNHFLNTFIVILDISTAVCSCCRQKHKHHHNREKKWEDSTLNFLHKHIYNSTHASI